jgi:hypothetical protein
VSENAPSPQDQPGEQYQRQQYQSQQYQSQQYPPQYAGQQIQFQPPGPQRDHPQGTLAFVLGLLSVLGITILAPFGWYYGRKVVREIDMDPASYSNRGLAMAGMVLGIIGTIFLILIVLFIVAAIIFAIAAPTTTVR